MIWILILMAGLFLLALADFDKKESDEDWIIDFCNGKPYKKRK